MIYKTYIGTKKPNAILLNIFAVVVMTIGVPIVMIKNLKLQPYDIALIAGFIFCCVGVIILSWSVSDYGGM